MPDSKPWFLVMRPEDANRPGSEWKREGVSHGKIVARPIASEGWIALAVFVTVWMFGPFLIWVWGYLGGSLSIVQGIIATIMFEIVAIGSFVLLVWAKSTNLPPAS